MNYLPMLSQHHIDLRSEVVTVSTFQGRCCLPGLGERRGVTERLWTRTRWAIRGRRNMRRRRGRGGNLGLARDCSRSCVIKFCDERQVKFKYVKLLRNVSVKCHSYQEACYHFRWPPPPRSASIPATRTPPSDSGRAAGPRWRPTTSCCPSSSQTSRLMPSNAL